MTVTPASPSTPRPGHPEDGSVRNLVWAILPLCIVILAGFLAIAVPLPVLAARVHEELGFSTTTAGLVIGLQSLVTVLTRQLAGVSSDVRGPRPTVLIGLPVASLAGLAYLVSAYIPQAGLSLALLLAGRVAMGFAESLFLTGAVTWGMARAGMRHTGKVIAWQGIALYAAFGLGAPLGLWLLEKTGFAGVAVATLLLPLAGLLLALLLPAAALAAGGGTRRAPFYKVIGLIWRHGLAIALASAPFAAMAAFIALYYEAEGWAGAGLAMTAFGAGYIVIRVFFAHMPDRIGGMGVGAVSLVAEAAGQLLLWSAPTAGLALLGAALTGIGFSLMFPAMGVEAMKRVTPENRGIAIGGFIGFFDLALAVTGPAAGLIAGPFGYRAVFLAGMACCLVAFALVMAARRPKPHVSLAEQERR
jgi:MFS family permease